MTPKNIRRGGLMAKKSLKLSQALAETDEDAGEILFDFSIEWPGPIKPPRIRNETP
jgi:hypothetical protein